MKNLNANQNLIIVGPSVICGLVLTASVASASPQYAERQRFVAPYERLTTPWYMPSDTDTSDQHVSLLDIVAEMKKGGFPVASIAQFVGVERKTVYSWLDGDSTPKADREERVAAAFPILKERFAGDYALLYRVLRSKNRDGSSLETILAGEMIDISALNRHLAFLDGSIESLKAADARKKAKPFKTVTGRNGAIEDSPVAVFEDI